MPLLSLGDIHVKKWAGSSVCKASMHEACYMCAFLYVKVPLPPFSLSCRGSGRPAHPHDCSWFSVIDAVSFPTADEDYISLV